MNIRDILQYNGNISTSLVCPEYEKEMHSISFEINILVVYL